MMHEPNSLVERALASPAGAACLAKTDRRLHDALGKGRFNTQSAIDLYTVCADDAVWTYLEGNALRRIIYRNYLSCGEGQRKGAQLALAFVARTQAADQRQPRRWLRFAWGP